MSANCFAATAGAYQGRTSVAVPTAGRRACSASRANHTIGSGARLGDAKWPPTQSESTPRSSSWRTASVVEGATTPISSGIDLRSWWARPAVGSFLGRRQSQLSYAKVSDRAFSTMILR